MFTFVNRMKNPIFYKTVSAKTVRIGQRCLTNHNKLLWKLEGADGVKTGFTKAAGRILVSSATRQGRRIIGVTIDAPDDWNDHCQLLNEGFSRYQNRQIVQSGQCVGTLEVLGGNSGKVQVLAAEDFSYALAQEECPMLVLPGPGFVYAPTVKGADAGFAYVLINGNIIGKLPVVYGTTVEQENEEKKGFWQKLLNH